MSPLIFFFFKITLGEGSFAGSMHRKTSSSNQCKYGHVSIVLRQSKYTVGDNMTVDDENYKCSLQLNINIET